MCLLLTRDAFGPRLSTAEAQGLFNRSALGPARLGRSPSKGPGAAEDAVENRARAVCDMTTARYSVWRQSTCRASNFGAFDAYVLRLRPKPPGGAGGAGAPPLSAAELALFDYPQNAWGGENAFLYLLRQVSATGRWGQGWRGALGVWLRVRTSNASR